MFVREKVIAALEAKAGRFAGYQVELTNMLAAYENDLARLAQRSRAEIEKRLAQVPWPGARPTGEHDRHPDIVIPFEQAWSNHEQARRWAREVLQGVPTIAVDGSQIVPSKEISIPVGAVQVGWFVNPHTSDRPYVKDLYFEILPPDELSEGEEVSGFPDWRVNDRRFLLECDKLVEQIRAFAESPVKPVCFFDGSLVISFVQHMQPERQRLYVDAVVTLLEASAHYRVPLVGYVDTSYAYDLVAMLDLLAGRPDRGRISDGGLLRPRMGWGDRTAAYICAREDKVLPLGGTKYYDQVCFVYLKTTAGRPPARLDLPRWLLEAGELERVVDVVRAECVVGNGYPYAVETADAVAVITHQDRERFYRLLQEFTEKENLPLRFSRKAVSKAGRRT